MAGQGKKTFVAGEVLTAQDVNGYLMDQSVMNFADSGARGSAIPTPTEGMVTYLADTNAIEVYDGSAFVGVGGLTLVKKQTIGSAVASVTVTDAFSATYDNYKIMVSGGGGSGSNFVSLTLGVANTNYYSGLSSTIFSTASNFNATTNNGSSFQQVGWMQGADFISLDVNVINPFLAKQTLFNGGLTSNGVAGSVGGFQQSTTSFTAFTLTPLVGLTMTGGTIYVYGYQN